ncbi:MFS transporter [Neofusicoccum parvum]|nr:MFS transporter [Neofusicoccum parvum]
MDKKDSDDDRWRKTAKPQQKTANPVYQEAHQEEKTASQLDLSSSITDNRPRSSSQPSPSKRSTYKLNPARTTAKSQDILEQHDAQLAAERRFKMRMRLAQKGWEHYIFKPLAAANAAAATAPTTTTTSILPTKPKKPETPETAARHLRRELRDTLVDRVFNFPRRRHLRVTLRTHLGITLTGFLYGGLHLLAWDAPFGSRAEQALWRLAGLTIAGSGLLVPMAHVEDIVGEAVRPFLLDDHAKDVEEAEKLARLGVRGFVHSYDGPHGEGSGAGGEKGEAKEETRSIVDSHDGWRHFRDLVLKACLGWVIEVVSWCRLVVVVIVGAVYFGLRVFIFVECLVNITKLPESAYQVVQWSQYTIDLSRPPAERYAEVVADFKPQLASLTSLFGEVVAASHLPLNTTTRLARLFLRRLHSAEQTSELRGISSVTGVPMYLLVCFNTLLDLFMGCTSGGARVRTPGNDTRMYHFRTLDWGMDALRRVVVQLEFVAKPRGPVVARSVTYVGYVGVLTGVREGLSVSLNFRPYHNDDTSAIANFRLGSHLAMVLLGLRPSISARLRDLVLAPAPRGMFKKPSRLAFPSLAEIKRKFPAVPTTAVYLIFCDGEETTVLEKDRVTAAVRSSRSFITITNCDVQPNGGTDPHANRSKAKLDLIGELLDEAEDRRECLERRWARTEQRFRRRKRARTDEEVCITPNEVVKWVQSWPTTNECTHYAVVMDPKAGDVCHNEFSRQSTPNNPHEIHDQTSRLPLRRLLAAYSCLAAIYFISFLDINSAATALPVISRALNAGTSITWAGTSYLMGQTAFQVLYGRLSDIFGRKPILLACVGFLVAGDALCGFARTPAWLYACRALSGVGGGGISSLVQITVSDLVSLRDRGKYQGLLSGAIGLGASTGPFVAAGLLRTGGDGWRWIFWVPPILAAACAVVMWVYLPLKPMGGSWREKVRKIDWFGLGAAVVGMLLVLIPINSGGSTWPWNSALVVSMLVIGGISFVLFLIIEKRFAPIPMIPLRLFGQASTTIIYIQSGLYNLVWQVDVYFLPVYFQDVRGYSPLQSATLVLPLLLLQSVAGVLSGPLMTKLARYGPVHNTGMAVWTLGAGMKLLFSRTTPVGLYVTTLVIEGTGIGLVFQPAIVAIQALSKPQDRAVATSTRNMFRALGSVVGVALSTAVQFAVMTSALPKALPSTLRAQVIDGSWQPGETGSEAWESEILNAKMKGIHAVFTMLVPMMGLCLIGCLWIPSIVLKGDERTNQTREGRRGDQTSP